MANLTYVIVAEDDNVIRKMIAYEIIDVWKELQAPALGGEIEVHEVDNGRDLVKKIIEGNYAFAFTDNNMPGGSGLEAVREIRRHNTRIPICMASSDTSISGKSIEEQAIEAGATDFLNKPFSYEELEAIVKKYCQRANNP